MRLKRIKLAGFKSFVDNTSIPFPGEMTAIVGPNGCGKSNVIDAVRWVLGESSAKNLRGDAMIDVIFNGSSARKPVSQCSVELVFDNTSGRIQGEFANYNELAVKRIVTREAQSTYLLNGTKCRRRDVTDIFLGTGLGPRSYAIIEQGMISRLIESKPQELRVFIEEAAGISKYKERRRETETRIRHTRENLERLEDVRGELSNQLDKLQRQATAAKRYKELKEKERALKGELAGIRWLAHHRHLDQLEKQIIDAETECEALIAKQRGEEVGLVGFKQQVSELTHTVENLQQSLFTVTTEITRIEQSQKYASQRTQQVTAELSELDNQLLELDKSLLAAESQVEAMQVEYDDLQPELLLVAEQLDAAIEERQTAEQTLTDFAQTYREQEQRYNHLKQQSQTCHGQIQSTMSMQMRTQQRLTDIIQELESLEQDQLTQQLITLQSEQELVDLQCDEAAAILEKEKDEIAHLNQQAAQLTEQKMEARGQVQRLEAESTALVKLQLEDNEGDKLRSALGDHQQLWQVLSVKPGFESLVDIAIQHHGANFVIESYSKIKPEWLNHKGLGFVATDQWQPNKIEGTLSFGLENTKVPAFFNSIYIADDYSAGTQLLSELPDWSSVVTKDGKWLSKDWLSTGVNESQGKTLRQAKISSLDEAKAVATEQLALLEQQMSMLQAKIEESSLKSKDSESALQHAQQAKFQLQNRIGVLQMQVEQTSARKKQLSTERETQSALLSKEQLQLDELSAKVSLIEEQLLDFESEQLHYEKQRERHESYVQETRSQVEQLTRQKHQMDIKEQQIKGQLENAMGRLKISQEQINSGKQRHAKLTHELEQLSAPESEQKAEIEVLIARREEIVSNKLENTEQLNQIQQLLSDSERGQQALNQQLQKRRDGLESLKLESQGYRVRADAVLEQLEEINQSLKDILERLPDNAEEKVWQDNLDKTQASITRLGAVNLAAVDEYDAQAERKQHLDMQFDDLHAALTTLEDAIRKIDKETKLRFSQTFEQVNNDLKSLFPKVFGGGSAYLALTEDDLLETGVTIMARPPGKKNSTIHLLSGGEKALTALSLVFAIFRLNPAPFCLLDEVDAPLDDANVERFCRLVSEMSKTVQFIYITHNKIAMEMAEHLTGVTMAEPGVSRMVAVDVDEAVAIANA